MVLNDHLLPVDPAAQDPLAAVQEVDAVVLDVEADQVAACGVSRKTIFYIKVFRKNFNFRFRIFATNVSNLNFLFYFSNLLSYSLARTIMAWLLKDSTHSGVKAITRLTLARGPGFSSSSFQRFFTP